MSKMNRLFVGVLGISLLCAVSGCAGKDKAERAEAATAGGVKTQDAGASGTSVRGTSAGEPSGQTPVGVSTPATAPKAVEDRTASEQKKPAAEALKPLFPHVRIDVAQRVVEFDASVSPEVHNPGAERTYLEVLACPFDTKEHETLVATKARPSHVHAALLAIGLTPGKPGAWEWDGKRIRGLPPEGPRVKVRFIEQTEQGPREHDPCEWVVHAGNGETLRAVDASAGWVFAGSLILKRQGMDAYEADGAGTLLGLTTFGTETIAWSGMYNHDSAAQEPVWIARRGVIPPAGTAVVVRITPEEPQP